MEGQLKAARLFWKTTSMWYHLWVQIRMQRESKKNSNDIEFLCSGILDLEFENEFDIILCLNAIRYISDDSKAKVLHKLAQMLKPDGVLVTGINARDMKLMNLPVHNPPRCARHNWLSQQIPLVCNRLYGRSNDILCLNAIRYISDDSKAKVLHKLAQMLKPDGVLVTGINARDMKLMNLPVHNPPRCARHNWLSQQIPLVCNRLYGRSNDTCPSPFVPLFPRIINQMKTLEYAKLHATA